MRQRNDKPRSSAEKKEDKPRNKPEGGLPVCWSRGNKAIIALWGSCKKLHYTAAEAVICYTYCRYMCCSSYMFYVLQVYLLYMLQVYVLQQLYVVASLGLLDFQGSSNVSSLSPSLCLAAVSQMLIFASGPHCVSKVELWWKMAAPWLVVVTVVAETSSRICFKQQCISHRISQRGVGQRGVFKYNLKFSRLKTASDNCILLNFSSSVVPQKYQLSGNYIWNFIVL